MSNQHETYIALFRGINVGGHHSLPMKELKLLIERNGCRDVRTYIQSGNVVFRRALCDVRRLEAQIAAAVAKSRGFEPSVMVLTREELEKAASANPFTKATENPKSLHLFFLSERPTKADLKGCAALKTKSESFEVIDRVFYLHSPDGFGTSKLAARAEKLLGVSATARNWRTVMALIDIAGKP
jgi:uncharacterized protein (DUF1697 family)